MVSVSLLLESIIGKHDVMAMGCSSVAAGLTHIHEVPGSIPSIEEINPTAIFSFDVSLTILRVSYMVRPANLEFKF